MKEERSWDPPLEILRKEVEENEDIKEDFKEDIKKVLNFLDSNLDTDWEFYFRPHLDDLCPDIVLLNEKIGIQIIEFEGKDSNPISRLKICKEEFLKFYIPKASVNNFRYELITCCLACPSSDEEELIKKVAEWRNEDAAKGLGLSNYFSIISNETLEEEDIKGAVPFSDWTSSKYMNKDLAQSLRAHLRTSDYVLADLEPLKVRDLDENQRNLVLSRSKSGYRNIRGSSGSGKSLVLAAKALQLIKENKSVILFTFNKTLPNLLRHYYERFKKGDDEFNLLLELNPNMKRENIPVFIHFMRYMKRHFYDRGQEETWKAFFTQKRSVEESMSQMCEVFMKERKQKKFDAVLVDEGQDFMPEWWNACRSLLKADGEAYFTIDNSQDIYKRENHWTAKKKQGSGLIGRPSILKTSYRLPREYVSYMRNFFKTFVEPDPIFSPDSEVNIPEVSPQLELAGVENCYLSWEQVDEEEGVERCLELVLRDLSDLVDKFAYSNITLLTTSKKSGRGIVEELEERNLKVTHTFSQDAEVEDAQKMHFILSTDEIKATTARSFKGFEAPLIVYLLEKRSVPKEVYTALTRLRMGYGNTCHIKVVCTNPKFRNYGNSWSAQGDQKWLKI